MISRLLLVTLLLAASPALAQSNLSLGGGGPATSAQAASRVTAGANAWPQQQVQPWIMLIDGPHIPVDATKSGQYWTVLNGSRILDFPTGLRQGYMQGLTFYFVQGISCPVGGCTITLGPGYDYPGQVTPILSTAAGAKDILPCVSDFNTPQRVSCGGVQPNLGFPAITGITQFTSANTFAATTANALIGALSVTMSSGSFTGTLAITGANTCGIVLSSTTLPSNAQAPVGGVSATAGPHGNGLCDDWSIQASQGNVVTQAEAAKAIAGPMYTFPNTAQGITNCGPTAVSTCASDTMNVTSGNNLLVFAAWFPASGKSVTSLAKTGGSATLGTCVQPPNGSAVDAFGNGYIYMIRCPITGTGTVVMTATMSAAAQYIQIPMFQMTGLAAAPDAGIGNTAHGFTTGPLTVATNGVTTQTNSFVLSVGAVTSGAATLTPSPGYTALINNSNLGSNTISVLIEWQQDPNSGDSPSNSMTVNSSQDWATIIQDLTHP